MKPALEYKGVVKRYGKFRALDGLYLRVPEGSVFGLVGSNGAGKTTALTAAAGLLELHEGRIDVLGHGPFDPSSQGGLVSLLPQDALFPPHARVEELLMFYGELQGLPKKGLSSTVRRTLKWVNLSDRARAKTRTLSHGMRRRLAIAQAFLGEPKLVLLDEPLNGLDPREVVNIRRLIHRRRGSTTIVISSHLLPEVEAVCDHVAVIEQGRTIRQSALSDFTGQREAVSYTLGDGEVPLASLEGLLPADSMTWDEHLRVLTVRFAADGHTAATVNALLLPRLIEADVQVLMRALNDVVK